jgi:hypothetical protein
MTNRLVIGFVGPSGSGKSEACRRLIERWGFIRVHAGMAIKDAARAGFRLTHDQVDGQDIGLPSPQLGGVTPRALLEALGKAAHEAAPQATAERLASDIALIPARKGRVVVDGIRKVEEAEAVKRMGGAVVRIIRPDRPMNPELPMDVMQDAIEADMVTMNYGSLDDLMSAIDQLGLACGCVRENAGAPAMDVVA